jgi:type IV pilus assembly protein PilM
MSRNLDVGGQDVTRTLHEGLNVTLERAEALKKSTEDFLNTPESAMIFPSLEMIASESQRMLESFVAKYPERRCQGVVLSGGTAQMMGLAEYYTRMIGLPVSIGNPWSRIAYDESVRTDIEKMGTSFSVALGLALAGIDALDQPKETSLKKAFSLKALLNKEL